jgi:hypothetical protein
MTHNVLAALTLVAFAIPSGAQNLNRRAELGGNGDPNHGKCTVEVVVDGTAEIEIRGDKATMHNINGQAPQWRRFQCTSAMPADPGDIRFTGLDGRGRQELVQSPQSGGGAVVRIEDPQSGSSGYTFDLSWETPGPGQTLSRRQGRADNGSQQQRTSNNSQPSRDADLNRELNNSGRGRDVGRQGERQRPEGDIDSQNPERGPGGRVSDEEAVRTCQDSIRQEAATRFGNANVSFRQTTVDSSRGPDWLSGTVAVSRPWYSRNEVYRFSCSIDYETGHVRTAHIGTPNY